MRIITLGALIALLCSAPTLFVSAETSRERRERRQARHRRRSRGQDRTADDDGDDHEGTEDAQADDPRSRRESRRSAPSSSASHSQHTPSPGDDIRQSAELLAQAFEVLSTDVMEPFQATMLTVSESDGIQEYEMDIPLPGVREEDIDVRIEEADGTPVIRITASKEVESRSRTRGSRRQNSEQGSRRTQRVYTPPPIGEDDLSGVNYVVRRGDKPEWERRIREAQREQGRQSPESDTAPPQRRRNRNQRS